MQQSTMQETDKQELQTLTNALLDVTDHVYHSLSLFEQLSARLEARCKTMDSGNTHTIQEMHAPTGKLPDYGVIKPLIDDPSINDILINGANQIYIERRGVLEATDLKFASEDDLITLATQIAHYCGRLIGGEHPLVDARLPDGSRVNIVVPPAAIDGVSISIRKFGEGKHDAAIFHGQRS